ncbi:hypothetical protein KDA_04520 [Dictyobacter alpinus]|uniref:histidine kinase n=1 Tax=Dictyobacter alpinus TaxID=2014873 RepID=A0A402B0V4_9CHLR|nr:sensor histidine kinase [Dictyobacter alpinus]GCE24968.1 hypothetical protein KDA_04520 [Dictyobacter alpinus]
MPSIARFSSTFYRLRWKPTFSYTIVTVLSLLVTFVLLLALTIWLFFNVLSNATVLAPQLAQQAPVAALFFDHGQANGKQVTRWVHTVYPQSYRVYHGFLAVVDLKGQVVAADSTETAPTTATLTHQLGSQAYGRLHQVLESSNTTDTSTTTLNLSGQSVILVPIRQPDDHTLQGVLVWNITQNPLAMNNMLYLSLAIEISLIALIFCVIFTIIGTFFGFFTARGFTRRLERLSAVVERWSQGNFQHEILDTSRDELGQVARQLNQMAQQLQSVFFTQRKLAVLEERNRLARELHDSVKQQVFSASMQLSTADSVIEQDTTSAQKHIQLAESLIDHVQQELASVIHALRPVDLERKSLELALTEYVRGWEQQTGIRTALSIDPLPAISPELETACYRVTQEALSNVARHSGARVVTVRLQSVRNLVTLNIHDNGHGFQVDNKQESGIGLQSMSERVEKLHGSLEISSDKRNGTTISVTYPLNEEQS